MSKSKYPKMSKREYEEALQHYAVPNTHFSDAIGYGWRQGIRYRNGDVPIPTPIAKFIRTMIRNRLSLRKIG